MSQPQPSTSIGSDAGGALRVVVKTLDLRKLRPAEQNPHFMSAEVFNRLVRNIKRDGVLTSAPLVHSSGDGAAETLQILSGHHRVKAALEAGIHEGACLVLEGDVTPERLRAIQLSHNALVGEDDMAQLQKLWSALPVDEQLYSGLSDGTFKLLGELPELANLRPVTNAMQSLNFVFLPADADMIREAIKKAGKRKNTSTLFAAAEAFDVVFDGLVEVKGRFDLIASSMGMLKLVELALERLRQLEQQEADAAAANGSTSAPVVGDADPASGVQT